MSRSPRPPPHDNKQQAIASLVQLLRLKPPTPFAPTVMNSEPPVSTRCLWKLKKALGQGYRAEIYEDHSVPEPEEGGEAL